MKDNPNVPEGAEIYEITRINKFDITLTVYRFQGEWWAVGNYPGNQPFRVGQPAPRPRQYFDPLTGEWAIREEAHIRKCRLCHWSDVFGSDISATEVLRMVPPDANLATWIEQRAREVWDDFEGLDFPALARQLTTEAGQ